MYQNGVVKVAILKKEAFFAAYYLLIWSDVSEAWANRALHCFISENI